MGALNSVVLVGNLTKDPELRHTQSGTAICKLRLAVNDRVKRDGEWQDQPYYFDVVVWGNQGESVATHMSKGRRVGIQGKLTWSEWVANDGTKRQKVEINAFNVMYLDKKEGGGGGSSGGDDRAAEPAFAASATEDFAASSADDDIPF